MHSRIQAPLIVLLLSIVPLAQLACREAGGFVPPPPPGVTVALPLQQEIVTYTEVPGRAEAVDYIDLRARVGGYLETVDYQEGAFVEADTLLYTIEPDEFEAIVEAAKARKQSSEAEQERSRINFERVDDLHKREMAPPQEYTNALAELNQAKANVLANIAALTRAELDLSYTRIVAPIAGRVNRTKIDAGNLVDKGTLLTTIVPWDPIHVYVAVGERQVLRFLRNTAIKKEDLSKVSIRLRLADGFQYPHIGSIDYMDNKIDPETGTLQVRVVFSNPDQLLAPGSFVRAQIPSPRRQSILVPEGAVQRDLGGSFVMIVKEGNEVDRADVTPGQSTQGFTEINSGLTGTERVIVNGFQRVRPGIEVKAETEQLTPIKTGSETMNEPDNTSSTPEQNE